MPSGTRNVDERIVEMRIDNQQFERGAKTTIGTLEKLEKALNLKTPKNSAISDLADQVSKFDASPMTTAIGKVGDSLSAMEVIGRRVIENLTDSVYNFATKTVKDLTIGQVGAGFDKYEQMIEATQTIMAATRDLIGDESSGLGWKDQSDQMKYVNAQLEKMLWYTDETSYSFTDMASNVGKFLAAGVDIDKAFTSMMGIASWGASAGAKPAEVSRAMYNISQAMGQGYMQLMDWKSIENANMGTLEFKQNVLEIAREMGILNKVMYENDESTAGYVMAIAEDRLTQAEDTLQYIENFTEDEIAGIITPEKFRESLSDKWLTSDVMTEVFSRYGKFADELYAATESTDLEATNVLELLDEVRELTSGNREAVDWEGWSKEAGVTVQELQTIIQNLDSIGWQFSENGFRMGQEAKTWSDAIDATKDAVSSGWMKTFELIFGDYLQAKDFWTEVTGELWDIFASGGEQRNKVLKEWSRTTDRLGHTGRDYLLAKTDEFQGALWDIIDAIHSVTDPIKEAFSEVFGVDGITLITLTRHLKVFTSELGLSEEAGKGLKSIFKALFTVLKAGLKVLGTAVSFALKIAYALNVIVDALLSNGDIGEALEVIRGALSGIVPSLMAAGELLLTVMGPVLIRIFEKIDPFTNKLQRLLFMLRTGFSKNGIAGALKNFEIWFKHLEKPAWLSKITSGLQFLLIPFGLIMAGVERLVSVFPFISNKFQEIKDTFKDANIFAIIWEKVAMWFQNLKPSIASVAESFSILRDVLKDAFAKGVDPSGIIELLKQAWTSLKGFVSSITFADIFKAISMALKVSLVSYLIGIIKNINWVAKNSKGVLESVSGMFGSIEDTFVAMQDSIKANILIKLAVAIGLLAGSLFLLSKVPTDKLVTATVALGGILFLMQKLMKGGGLSLFSEENVNKNFKGILNGATINLLPKLAANLLGLSVALGAIFYAIVAFKKNKVNTTDILKVVGTVGLVLLMMGGFMAWMERIQVDDITKSFGILATLAAVVHQVGKLAVAVKDIKTRTLLVAMGGMALIIAAMGLLVSQTSRLKNFNGKMILSVAVMLLSISQVMRMLVAPIVELGSTSSSLVRGIGAMSLLFLMIGGLTAWMSRMKTSNFSHFAGIAAGMVALSFGIRMLIGPVIELGSTGSSLTRGAAGLGLLMLMLGGLTAWMSRLRPTKMVATAASMVIMALAIQILMPAFTLLASVIGGAIATIPWDKLTSNVDGFSNVLLKLLGFGGAMVLFGYAMKLIGTGVLRFGSGALRVSGSVVVFSLAILAVAAAIHLLSDSLPEFVQALLDTFTIIKDNATEFIEMFGLIIAGIAAAILARKLEISMAVVEVIVAILTVIALKGPEILDALSQILDNLMTWFSGMADIIADFFVGAIVFIIAAMATALNKNQEELATVVTDLIGAILHVVSAVFQKLFGEEFLSELNWLEAALLGVASGTVGKMILNNIFSPFKSVSDAIGSDKGKGSGLIGKLKSVSSWIDTAVAAMGGMAVVGPALMVAFGAIYAGGYVNSQHDQFRNEAFAGAEEDINGYLTAIQNAKDSITKAQQEHDNLVLYGGDLTMIDEELAARQTVLNNLYQDFAKILGVTKEELKAQAEAEDGDLTRTKAYQNYIKTLEDAKRAELELDSDSERSEKFARRATTMSEAVDANQDALKEIGAKEKQYVSTGYVDEINAGSSEDEVLAWINNMTSNISGQEASIADVGRLIFGYQGDGYAEAGNTMIPGLAGNTANGFFNNILSRGKDFYNSGWFSMDQYITGAENRGRIKSPSRAMADIAKFMALGFINENKNQNSNIYESGVSTADQFLKAIMSTMAQAAYIASDEFDFSPRITPVVDMGNVSSAASYVNGAFGGSYSMSASMSNAVSRRLGDVGQIAANMSGGGNQTVNGDQITFNIYQQPGESTDALADAVISRINSKMIRRRAAFG